MHFGQKYLLLIIEYADDAVGLELVTEPFIDNLSHTLIEHFKESVNDKVEVNKADDTFSNNCDETSSNQIIEEVINLQSENIKNIFSEAREIGSLLNESLPLRNKAAEMNLNRPVVSSCFCLTSSDKQTLGDLCRQLIEPSENLKTLNDEELNLPNVTFSPVQSLNCLFSSFELNEISHDFMTDIVAIDKFLEKKVQNDAPFFKAQIKFNQKLCKLFACF